MLFENQNVSQREDGIFRRWFEDEFFELIVWYDKDKRQRIKGFQLCYDRFGDERALTWLRETGFNHEKIDDTRGALSRPSTPILVPDGIFQSDVILKRFKENSKEIDKKIAAFVKRKIKEYAGKLYDNL